MSFLIVDSIVVNFTPVFPSESFLFSRWEIVSVLKNGDFTDFPEVSVANRLPITLETDENHRSPGVVSGLLVPSLVLFPP